MWVHIALLAVLIFAATFQLSKSMHAYLEHMFSFEPTQRSSAEFKVLVDALALLKSKLEEAGITLDKTDIVLPRLPSDFSITEHIQDRYEATRDYGRFSAVMWSQRCPFTCDVACDAVSDACALCRKSQVAGIPPCGAICDILKGGCKLLKYACTAVT